MKRLNIFKSGAHLASSGEPLEFTEADLVATAEGYDPALHEAPIVIGHPKTNAPAFGWIKTLNSDGASLLAEPHQVNADFEELVKAGSYKKISASFYSPSAPGNPTPGVYYLRHVGFLGAQPPAVKGLSGVEFDENEEGIVTFEDAPLKSWQLNDIKNLFRNLREWIIGEKGKETADTVIPDYMIDNLAPLKPDTTNFNEEEEMTPEELKKKEKVLADERIAFEQEKAEFEENQKNAEDPNPDKPDGDDGDEAARADDFAERDAKIKNLEEKLERKDFMEFVDGLVKEGKVLPRDKENIVSLMAVLPKGEATIEFAEDGQTVKTEPLAAFKKHLSALPVIVNFDEISGGDLPSKTDEYKEEGKLIAEA